MNGIQGLIDTILCNSQNRQTIVAFVLNIDYQYNDRYYNEYDLSYQYGTWPN